MKNVERRTENAEVIFRSPFSPFSRTVLRLDPPHSLLYSWYLSAHFFAGTGSGNLGRMWNEGTLGNEMVSPGCAAPSGSLPEPRFLPVQFQRTGSEIGSFR